MNIHTDGGCINNGHPDAFGAWAFVCEDGFESSGFVEKTTNNRTELQAVIEALKYAASKRYDCKIFTDSDLTVKCATGVWRRKKNRDLWAIYASLHVVHSIEWVRGHNGDPGNERADELCRLAMTKSRRCLSKPALRNAQLSLDGMSALQSVHAYRSSASHR